MSWVKANTIKLNSATPVGGLHTSASKHHHGANTTMLLSMYDEGPGMMMPTNSYSPTHDTSGEGEEISLEEFERFAVDRLHVLRGIEDIKVQMQSGQQQQQHDEIIKLVDSYLKGETKEATVRKDVASHFILRLAFCQTEEKRRWFLNQECDLFRARFKEMLASDQRAFIERYGLPVEMLSASEFDEVKENVRATVLSVTNSMSVVNSTVTGPESLYKVDFEDVADLVGARRVFVKRGVAYVSKDQIGSIVMAPFRSNLSKQLALLSRQWNAFCSGDEKDRLVPLVSGLSERYLGPEYTGTSVHGVDEQVTAAMLPKLKEESFPLCMSVMMDSLRTQHHLKHTGRQQLGLFLKGIGLPLEEAIRFWRTEMAQVAPGDAFDKQYLYNIRHNYGKEGKRQDYTPHSCLKVIGTMPGPGQVHGCPYRVLGEAELRDSLARLNINRRTIDQAVSKAAGGHYQLACATVWEGAHGGCSCDTGINHPNQYYAESRKQRGAVDDETMRKAKKHDGDDDGLVTPAPKMPKIEQ